MAISKIYLQIILAPMGEECLFPQQYKRQIELYTKGIVQKQEHQLLACKVLDDHIHLFIEYTPTQALPLLIHDIKTALAGYMNANQWFPILFEWQLGYGVFSFAQSQVNDVINFVNNQEEHHQKHTFESEYRGFLKKFEINCEEEDVFEFYKS